MGACRLDGNNWLLPTANDTTDLSKPLPSPPILHARKCDTKDKHIVLGWNSTGWEAAAYCDSALECLDFQNVEFAVCQDPTNSGPIWLPWPITGKGLDKMCKRDEDCKDNFQCRSDVELEVHGCYAQEFRHALNMHMMHFNKKRQE